MADETPPAITIETFTGDAAPAPDALTDEQKTFLTEHAADLSDEQATKYGIEKPTPPLEPETRSKTDDKKDDDADDDEMDPDDKKKIGKLVSDQVTPLAKQLKETNDKAELNGFLGARPEFAKYREAIWKHMQHPAYANIPVDRIAKMVAGDDLIKIGAQKEREAAAKAAATKAGGNTSRLQPTGKNWSTATKEEFEAQKAAVLGRQGA